MRNSNLHIELATKIDCNLLTDIAFAAKRHWNYPEEYYNIWTKELTITPQYLEQAQVYKGTITNQTVGFYSLVDIKQDTYFNTIFINQGMWLEHIFILPQFHLQGIGTYMIKHVKHICSLKQIPYVYIFVDPNALGFYTSIGAQFVRNSDSSIPNRTIPIYKLLID
ncbi:MAG TPA: GNAT family N-acetyltransferase [Bacteroidales bacterium]|nr:GNAT family N-acetyltransferase [Bacteroidales bacterium]